MSAPHRMLATLIIPLLDQRVDWLDRCMSSALHQTNPCEVIVVYSEQTRDAALTYLMLQEERYVNLTTVKRPPGSRFPGAINLGFKLATAARVGLVFTDDWIELDCVARCLSLDTDIVSTSQTGFDADGITFRYRRNVSPETFSKCDTLEEKARCLGHFFLFKAAILDKIGGVDENVGLTGCDDFDMIWSMLERNASVGIVEDALYNARDHQETRLTMRSKDEQVEDMKKVLVKHGVRGIEFDRLIALHSRWYGRPVHHVMQETEDHVESSRDISTRPR